MTDLFSPGRRPAYDVVKYSPNGVKRTIDPKRLVSFVQYLDKKIFRSKNIEAGTIIKDTLRSYLAVSDVKAYLVYCACRPEHFSD